MQFMRFTFQQMLPKGQHICLENESPSVEIVLVTADSWRLVLGSCNVRDSGGSETSGRVDRVSMRAHTPKTNRASGGLLIQLTREQY